MRFLTSVSSIIAFLLLVFIPSSLSAYGAGLPHLRHERRTMEERTFLGSLGSLFGKRDDCGNQYGPTYVDCGARGCYQPSLGEICCGSEGDYCLVGQYCVGLICCPNGLLPSCCGTGFNCPANASDYYTTTSTTPPSGTTSLPAAITNSAKVSTTSAKPSTSLAPTATTSVSTSAPATLKSTSSVVVGVGTSRTSASNGTSSSSTGPATVVPASGAHEKKMMMGSEAVAVAVLGVVGLVAGLM